jgi:hypothetical protein
MFHQDMSGLMIKEQNCQTFLSTYTTIGDTLFLVLHLHGLGYHIARLLSVCHVLCSLRVTILNAVFLSLFRSSEEST